MTPIEFWRDVYVTGIREGNNPPRCKQIADEAVDHYIEAQKLPAYNERIADLEEALEELLDMVGKGRMDGAIIERARRVHDQITRKPFP